MEADPPDFASQVLPILQRSCFECHGPEVQEGDLRLDDRTAALDHASAIVPGDAENSEILRRTTLPAGDPEIMPAVGKPLNAAEIALIRGWIEAGAVWPENAELPVHWAYVPPLRPELPTVRDSSWVRNEIDFFMLSRLEKEGMAPSPEASRETLVRRVYLDLIGLPPAPEEVDAFLSDDRPDAYAALVDRLLASPHFGERWARPWLDLARYADSHGFQRDDLREIWAYRDWVIRALNDDMPFNQFTIEQLAGDLLPNSTEQQKIATGFHRCTMINVEAGSEPEETRVNQVIDRVNTTATVWLGATLECAQCHDHKYDPFTQKEYYQLFAFFNNTAIEAERAKPKAPGSIRFLGPSMKLRDEQTLAKQRPHSVRLKKIDRQLAARRAALRAASAEWESALRSSLAHLAREHVLQLLDFESAEGAGHVQLDDGSVLLVDDPPDTDTYVFATELNLTDVTGFKLEALTDESLPGTGPGRGDALRPNFVLNTFAIEAAPAGSEQFVAVRLRGATADYSQVDFDVSGAIDDDLKTGWAIGRKFFMPHWAQFELERPLDCSGGAKLRFRLVQQHGGGRTIGRFRISAITGPLRSGHVPADIALILERPPEQRSREERGQLEDYRMNEDAEVADLQRQRAVLEARLQNLAAPTTLVMQEQDEPRRTHIFMRGDYTQSGEPVQPDVPAVLHPLPSPRRDRLALAEWIVDRRNPLVARVTVNRWWAEIFGHGLVETLEDFGVKGLPPTHPELLDWLAVEFMDQEWSMKKLLRTIVTSATYRQTSKLTPELLARDDQNRLYGRGPRVRMDAEMVRDNALRVAGLLSEKQFGPPIRPYQPEGIWVKVGGARADYEVSPGEDRYRRGIYVVVKRGSPYPSFINFDGSGRLACTVTRSRSNTPLQALTLLNDPVYVEAAQALAIRVVGEQPAGDVDARIRYLVRLCLARSASPIERNSLRQLYAEQLAAAKLDPEATRSFVGDLALPSRMTRDELVAWYAVATVLLNLDETITKE